MNLSAGFIRRPVTTTMLMVAVCAIGVMAYRRLPVAALPTVDTPTIQITSSLPGADPQTMVASVVTPLERQFGQIPGLQQMTSSASTGNAQVTLQFALGRSIDGAATDVQSAVTAAGGQLPKSLPTPPTYRKVNPADVPRGARQRHGRPSQGPALWRAAGNHPEHQRPAPRREGL